MDIKVTVIALVRSIVGKYVIRGIGYGLTVPIIIKTIGIVGPALNVTTQPTDEQVSSLAAKVAAVVGLALIAALDYFQAKWDKAEKPK